MEPSVNMLTATFLWIVIGCWSIVVSAEVTITRDSRNDLMQFSNCSQNIDDFCHQFNADPYGNDGRLCSCQCKRDYVMYRDPDVNISFGYEPGKRECVWWSHNHEGKLAVILFNANSAIGVAGCNSMMREHVLNTFNPL